MLNPVLTRRSSSTGIFSAQYKHFDQISQTLKNETTVLNLAFISFLQTSIPPLISMFYAKEGGGVSRFSVEKFCLAVSENFV